MTIRSTKFDLPSLTAIAFFAVYVAISLVA
jgi:hypothetical protein